MVVAVIEQGLGPVEGNRGRRGRVIDQGAIRRLGPVRLARAGVQLGPPGQKGVAGATLEGFVGRDRLVDPAQGLLDPSLGQRDPDQGGEDLAEVEPPDRLRGDEPVREPGRPPVVPEGRGRAEGVGQGMLIEAAAGSSRSSSSPLMIATSAASTASGSRSGSPSRRRRRSNG